MGDNENVFQFSYITIFIECIKMKCYNMEKCFIYEKTDVAYTIMEYMALSYKIG